MDGNPLFLRLAVDRIQRTIQQARMAGRTLPMFVPTDFPNEVNSVFEDVYRRISGRSDAKTLDSQGKLRAALLHLLVVAREPLSIGSLRGLLECLEPNASNGAGQVTFRDVRNLVMEMSEYLLAADEERFLPWHEGLSEYVRNKVLGKEGVAVIHSVFCQWCQLPSQRQSNYWLRYLPTHWIELIKVQINGGRDGEAELGFRRLATLLTDFDFIAAKTDAGLVFDLVRDYLTIRSQLSSFYSSTHAASLRMWHDFIERESHVLSRYPELLLQQAVNQPANSSVAKSAEEYISTGLSSRPYLRWRNKTEEVVLRFLVRTITGHLGQVLAIAITRDDRYLISAGGDCTIKVWDFATGQLVRTLEGHKSFVNAVAVTEDGRYIVSGSADTTVRIWDLTTGLPIRVLSGHDKTSGFVNAVAVTSDNKYVVSGGADKVVILWDFTTGKRLHVFRGHDNVTGYVNAVAISFDGEFIASGGADKTVRCWKKGEKAPLPTLRHDPQTGYVNTIALTPSGKHLISGGADNAIKIWDTTGKAKEIRTLRAHTGCVNALALSADAKHLISAGADTTVCLWSLDDFQKLKSFDVGEMIRSAVITSDARYAVTSAGQAMKVWDLSADIPTVAHQSPVSAMAFSPKSNCWLVTRGDGSVAMHSEDSAATEICPPQGHSANAIAITPDENWAVIASSDTTIRRVKLDTHEAAEPLPGHKAFVNAIIVSADGRFAFSGSSDHSIKVWGLDKGNCIATLNGHTGPVNALRLTGDGKILISVGDDGDIRLWDIAKRKCLDCLNTSHRFVTALALIGTNHLLTGGSDRRVCMWNLAKHQVELTFEGHTDTIRSISYMSDVRLIVSSSYDQTVKVWDVSSGTEITTAVLDGLNGVSVVDGNGNVLCGDNQGGVRILTLEGMKK